MAVYSELIKNFEKIREYVRDFYIFGFRTREQFHEKSNRTYDNEKRRIESWLSEYIHTSQNGHKKKVSVQVDSCNIFQNPLYQCYHSKSFTDNDIRLHFLLLEVLEQKSMAISEIADTLSRDYGMVFDIQIIRLKLKEYVEEGLLAMDKQGKTIFYKKSDCYADSLADIFPNINDMITYFSEENPFGVIGNFMMDKLHLRNTIFTRKHAYMVHTLDDEILLELFNAITLRKSVKLTYTSRKNKQPHEAIVAPLKIHCSVQTGRNYLIAYSISNQRLVSVRLDSIVQITLLNPLAEYDTYYRYYETNQKYLWGTSFGNTRKYGNKEHIYMEILIDEKQEQFVVNRLKREKRSGIVTKISDGRYAFDIDLFDANEAFPWIKTFIGRIAVLETTNQELQNKFQSDIVRLYKAL